MTRQYQRNSKEQLAAVVAVSDSFTEVCRRLNKKPVGGTITNIKLMCDRWEIDYSHMTGQGWAKGQASSKRIPATQRLVLGTPLDHRTPAHRLRQSMFEVGFEYRCNCCGIGPEWNGQPLVLEIDHIDEQYWNNTKENLQFLCPNCHAQKTKNAPLVEQQTR